MNIVKVPTKTTNPVLQERDSSGWSLLIREWYRLVPFCEVVSDQQKVLVAVQWRQWPQEIHSDAMERVTDFPIDQRKTVSFGWISAFLKSITTSDKMFDISLESWSK